MAKETGTHAPDPPSGEPPANRVRRGGRVSPVAAILFLILQGCGPSGDVEALNDGRYATTARGYHEEAGTRALDRAQAHCESMGRVIRVEDIHSAELDPGFYRTTLTFRCVDEDSRNPPRPEPSS